MRLGEAATAYARGEILGRAVPVFPLVPGGKLPHPQLGFRRRNDDGSPLPGSGGVDWATCDLEAIATWWSRWPDANIGLALRCLMVLDVEGASKGFDPRAVIADIKARCLPFPPTATARTAGGGVHLVYGLPPEQQPLGDKLFDRDCEVVPGVEVRYGARRYIVGAPSLMGEGGWRWMSDVPQVAAAPEWLLRPRYPERPCGPPSPPRFADGNRGTRYALAALEAEAERVRTAVPPGRHDQLYKSAAALGELVGAGELDPIAAAQELQRSAQENGLDGARAAEVERTITDGLRAGFEHPRSYPRR